MKFFFAATLALGLSLVSGEDGIRGSNSPKGGDEIVRILQSTQTCVDPGQPCTSNEQCCTNRCRARRGTCRADDANPVALPEPTPGPTNAPVMIPITGPGDLDDPPITGPGEPDTCAPKRASCVSNSECCSDSCRSRNGRCRGGPEAPMNNECSTAAAISMVPSGAISGTTEYATATASPFGSDSPTAGPAVWYSFTGTGGTLSLRLDCDMGWEATVAVADTNRCNRLRARDPFFELTTDACAEGAVLENIETQAGENYYIVVTATRFWGAFDLYLEAGMDDDASPTPAPTAAPTPEFCLPKSADCDSGSECCSGRCRSRNRRCRGGPAAPANNECGTPGVINLEGQEDVFTIASGDPVPNVNDGTTQYATVSTNIFRTGTDTAGPSVWYGFVGNGTTLQLRLDCDAGWDGSVSVVRAQSCRNYRMGDPFHTLTNACAEGAVLDDIDTMNEGFYYVIVTATDGWGQFDLYVEEDSDAGDNPVCGAALGESCDNNADCCTNRCRNGTCRRQRNN